MPLRSVSALYFQHDSRAARFRIPGDAGVPAFCGKKAVLWIRQGSCGFTLIALIVAIAIIGILAAIGAAAYSGSIELASQASDKQLISDLSCAIQLNAADEGLNGEEDCGHVSMTAEGMEACWGEYANDTMDDMPSGEIILPSSSHGSGSGSAYAQALVTDMESLDEESAVALAEQWLEDGLGSSWREQGFQSDCYSSATAVIVLIPSGEWQVVETTCELFFTQTIAENLKTYAASSYRGSESDLMTSVEGVATTFGGMLANIGSSGNTAAEGLAMLLGYL